MPQVEALGVLRVGGDHGGEVPVDDHLLGHADHMLHTHAAEHLGDQLVAGAVEGGVDHLEGVRHLLHRGAVVDLSHDVGQEALVGLLPHHDDLPGGAGGVAGGAGGVEVRLLHRGEEVQLRHLLGDGVGVVGGQLGAVGPVDLIAVVLLGVVAGGDVDARDAAVLPDGEGQLGGGAEGLEEPDGDAVARHDTGGLPGELGGVVAAVEAHGHPLGGGLGPLGQDDLGEGLGGMADHMHVHVVQAHRHGAAEAGGAELQGGEEPALDLLGIVGDGLELRLLLGAEGGALQPLLIGLHVGHFDSSFITLSGPRQIWSETGRRPRVTCDSRSPRRS